MHIFLAKVNQQINIWPSKWNLANIICFVMRFSLGTRLWKAESVFVLWRRTKTQNAVVLKAVQRKERQILAKPSVEPIVQFNNVEF